MMRIAYIASAIAPVKKETAKERLLQQVATELLADYARDELKAKQKHASLLEALAEKQNQLNQLQNL